MRNFFGKTQKKINFFQIPKWTYLHRKTMKDAVKRNRDDFSECQLAKNVLQILDYCFLEDFFG
jgi:hypothetical protein